MTEPILDDPCQQPRLIATTEKYAQLVHDSTTELHQPVQSILSTLDRRAIGLTKCLNFESALRDANLMQQLSPSSPLGYLRAAQVHIQQGKQRQAFDICNDGILMVDPKDTHYATLLQLKMDAKERGNTRIDFISQLPIDIVIATLIPMIMENNKVNASEPCAYLQVSNVWSDRIIQCFNGLRFKVVEGADMSQVIQFAGHTKSVSIQQHSHGNWPTDLIKENHFSSLQKIKLFGYRGDNIDHLVSALKSVRSTLTHLRVDTGLVPEFSAHELVLACPNLVSFQIQDTAQAHFIVPATTTAWPNLTTLMIDDAGGPITCQEIISMWQRFPALKELTLYPCANFSSAFIISEYLPRMKRLDIQMFSPHIQLTSYEDEGSQTEEPGLTRLWIGSDDEELEVQEFRDICTIIKHYHKTLEHIQWTLRTDHDSNILDNVQYPRLKRLFISWTGWQIPRNAPNLEDLSLTSSIIKKHPQVLDTIPRHLKNLDLQLPDELVPSEQSSILQCLDRISQALQLKELVIRFRRNPLNTIEVILDAVCRHHHLEALTIRSSTMFNSNPIEPFCNRLVKGCPRLVSLEIMFLVAPTTSSVNILKRLEHLKEFAFSTRGIQDEDSFWHAIETFDQLKCIKVQPDIRSMKVDIAHLRHRRPDMKIILDPYILPFS